MSENPSAAEWSAARGEKWLAQLSGMEAMLAPVDEPLIRALRLDAPCRIAEVGCGGGGTTLEIARRAPKGSVVHGFDLSAGLIEAARQRLGTGDRDIAFEVADMATATPERPYDRLVSRFGIMFFDDAPGAFANLARWLRPGGRFAFAVWGRLSENAWMTTVRDAVAEAVEIPKTDHEAPGPFRYADAEKLLALLDRAGFGQLAVEDWHGELAMGGGLPAAQAANFALASFSSFAELLAQAGETSAEKARGALTARYTAHQQQGVVRLGACVHLVTGLRL
jgi:SAM-dependent methyltransferase